MINIKAADPSKVSSSSPTLLTAFEKTFNKSLSPAEFALQLMKAPLAAEFNTRSTLRS